MKIETEYLGKRYVISDIHGCSKTFRALIEEKIDLQKNDFLFLLGDYIDRGLNSADVIEYIFLLIKNGFNVFPLRGNHEQNILDASKEFEKEMFRHFVVRTNKSPSLLNENNEIIPLYFNFFNSLEYYYELDDFIIVHAGINFKAEKPFEDKIAMLELRKTEPDLKIIGNKKIIVGHNVTYLKDIEKAINERKTIINLDNGCPYTKPHKIYDFTQTGNLCCLNLDTFELIIQKNIDL